MKVVFLDVDGVLNRSRPVNGVQAFDLENWVMPHAVSNVNRVTRATGAKVVVSSTWRIGKTVEQLRDMFAFVGLEAEIVDKTPTSLSGYRGHEIDRWLQLHPEVKEFVILDDGSDMDPHASHLVQTGCYVGLTRRHVKVAIQKLGGETNGTSATDQGVQVQDEPGSSGVHRP